MGHFGRITRIQLEDAADYLIHRLRQLNTVDLVIQMGSGQTARGLLDEEWDHGPLQEMPGMPKEESLAQQPLTLRWGRLGNYHVLVFGGRYHWYEGYGRIPIILPIWTAITCGARNFLFSNAAGGIREDLSPGRFMLISDHINNLGVSSLAGHQHLLRSSYVDMAQVYNEEVGHSLQAAAKACGEDMSAGIYMANTGPQFETPAEVRMAHSVGADAIGMSTVLEATAAHAMGARVAALSMIANRASGLSTQKITHREALQVGRDSGQRLTAILRRWLTHEAQDIL